MYTVNTKNQKQESMKLYHASLPSSFLYTLFS